MPKKSLATTAKAAEEQENKLPQTDSQIAEMPTEGSGNEPHIALPQTDIEADEIQTGDPENASGYTPDSHVETETNECQPGDDGLQAEPPYVSQTETEIDPELADYLSAPGASPEIEGTADLDEETTALDLSDDTGSPQTDSESAAHEDASPDAGTKKPRRRSVKSQSGETDDDSSVPDPSQAKPPKTTRRRAKAVPVLAIDEQRTVETQEDKLNNDLLDLVESMKGKKILAGTIQGVERSADNPNLSFAVIYHGAFKVIIPAEETVQPPTDFRDRSPADVMHYLVTKRLGAEVDFIVKGVDAQSGIAAASRLEAMALKRRQYYFGTDRDGNNLIYEGFSAEARVVSVIRAGIFVDLFGLETYIAVRELSYQRWIDAAAHFQPGQRVLVKILTLDLDRTDRSNIHITASVKQSGDNPYEQALKRYTPGSRYVGTVSMVDTNGVFVSLEGGIDCLCSYPKRGRPPRGSRVTVRIIGVNPESNRIWGAITHMTTAR